MKPSEFIPLEDAAALRQLEPPSSGRTPLCCLSRLRSSLEAGKKQLRVWIEYVCSVAKMILYSSFGAPLVFLGSPYNSSEMVRRMVRNGVLLAAHVHVSYRIYSYTNLCS